MTLRERADRPVERSAAARSGAGTAFERRVTPPRPSSGCPDQDTGSSTYPPSSCVMQPLSADIRLTRSPQRPTGAIRCASTDIMPTDTDSRVACRWRPGSGNKIIARSAIRGHNSTRGSGVPERAEFSRVQPSSSVSRPTKPSISASVVSKAHIQRTSPVSGSQS